jgi:hypothetical protein
VGKERTIEALQGFLTAMGEEILAKIVFDPQTWGAT